MKPKVFISNHLFAFKERKNGKKDVEKVAKVWRCFFLSAIMTLFVITAQAETYYVSNSGSDSNSGTSTSLPWKTLDKVNGSSFKPGDQILFNRGDEWTGTISVTSSGSTSGSIVYGAYGTGENPIIYGSQLLSGWTRYSGNIYKATCNSGVTQLFLNNTRLNVARYPNEGNLSVSNVNSSVQFTSTGLTSAGANYYKGAKLNITTNEWRLDSRDVIASSGQTLTLDSETSYGLSKGQHFFLVNKLEFLDQPGQWYFDEATKTVYLWTPKGDSPDNYKIRGSIYSDGITVVNKNYITVKDLNLWQHSDRGINSAGANNTFENNSILYPETIGIQNKGDNCKISGNTINGINHIGISHIGANGNISVNEILNTALFNNLGIKGMDGYSQAVASAGNNTTISYNRVINAGYNGIAWTGQNCNLSYNYVENVCTYLFDGGAIYTYSTDVNKLVSSGSVVSHNIIYNCRGTASLYMDNRTRDVVLEYNTVVNDGTGGNYGMFFHDNKNVKARYNTIFNMKTGTRATLNYGGNVFSNNIVCNIAETNANGDSPKLAVINSDEKTLSLDNNTYIDHHRTKAFMNTKTYSYLTFKEWQAAISQEGSSSIDNSALKSGEKEVLFFNDTKQVKTINLGNVVYKGIDGTTVSGKLTLQPFSSVILIQTSSVVPVNNKPQIDGQSFYIDEIKKAGDFVGQVIASDPDAGQALSYGIVSGNDDKLFTLDPVTGVISAGSEINFSEDKTVVLFVEVTDNATSPLSAQVDITIYIKATDLGDVTPPNIVSFSIPATSTSLTVPVQSFEASDNSAIGGYLLTESSDIPLDTDQGWSTSVPTSYTFSGYGEKILYAWVKDDAGNLSGFAESTVFIKDMTPVYTTEDISLCEGESYNGWTTTGQYTRTLQTINGVDSIVTTNLYVNPGYNLSEDITINEGESYLGWTVSGEYQHTLAAVSGCDSIVTTNLTVVKSNTDVVESHHSEYLFEENSGLTVFDTKGTNNGTIVNQVSRKDGYRSGGAEFGGTGYLSSGDCFGGCISNEVTVSAWIKPVACGDGYHGIVMHGGPVYESFGLYLMPGSKEIGFATSGTSGAWLRSGTTSELWDGEWHHIAATYNNSEKIIYIDGEIVAQISATGDMDSGVGYNLLIGAGRDIDNPIYLYKGLMDEVNVFNYGLTASEVKTLMNVKIVAPDPVYTSEDISVCEGESYQGWKTTGQYTRTLQTTDGTDSIVTTNLYVNPVYYVSEDITINEGESYLSWTVSGEYQRMLTSVSGCDSIVTTKLTVVKSNTNPVYASEDISVCEGESYQGWKTTGQYTRTLQTTDGIDSIVTTNLYVNPVYTISEEITINEGESYLGWAVSGEYQRTLTSVSGCDSIVTTNLTVIESAPVIPVVTQEIDLSRKWNIFSSYIIPEEKDMISILKDLTNSGSLVKVVDEYDRTFEQAPDGTWINNIGDFSEAQGYKILLESNSLLNIQGAKVSLPFELHLNEGWNIISFPYSEAANAMDVVQSLIDENLLIKVQNEQGRSLEDWGRRFGWVNRIGDFIPGEGYLVKVNAPCTLTIQDSYLKSSVLVPEEESLVYFNRGYSGNAREHMNIYVDLMESGLQAGDEIAAYDGEICVGAHKISYDDMANNSASLIVSLADEGEQNGFIAGNQIVLKGWSSASGREINIASEILSGEMIFQEGGSVLVQIVNELTTGINDNILLDVSMYPNPATSDFVVKLSVLPDIDTQVVISDISGKQMASRVFRSNIETFDVRNFPSGVYFVDIRIGNSHEVKKLVKQ